MIRQDDSVYCAHREEGGSPIKTLTTWIGQRHLLGMGTGGTAVLGYLDATEIFATSERNATAYAAFGVDAPRLLAMSSAVREQAVPS